MKVSLRLILIEDDDGLGKNVRPLAQQEILKTEIVDGEDPVEFVRRASLAAQDAIRLFATIRQFSG